MTERRKSLSDSLEFCPVYSSPSSFSSVSSAFSSPQKAVPVDSKNRESQQLSNEELARAIEDIFTATACDVPNEVPVESPDSSQSCASEYPPEQTSEMLICDCRTNTIIFPSKKPHLTGKHSHGEIYIALLGALWLVMIVYFCFLLPKSRVTH